MNGNRFMLSKDGVAVAAVVTNDVETQAASIERAGASQGRYREYIKGRKTWTMTCEWLMVSSAMMVGLIYAGQTFAISCYDRDSINATRNVHGVAYLDECKIQMTQGQVIHGHFRFHGNGDMFAQITQGDFNFDFNNDFFI